MSFPRWGSIPRPVTLFFARALAFFLAWKILYLLWLLPTRVLDEPLTRLVGVSTAAMLNLPAGGGAYTVRKAFDSQNVDGGVVSGYVMDIYYNGQKTLRIADACNGLELMVLYAAFLFCYPGRRIRRLLFLFAGIGMIFVLNVIRCSLLIRIYLYNRRYLDFSHHFVFTIVVYSFIFLLWYFYTRDRGKRKVVLPA